MAAFDYKKEYKALYLPKATPEILEIPPISYVAVEGSGNPNEEDGAYKAAVGILYSMAYTIKMSYKAGHEIDGYFQYVVPPLEGLWWMADGKPGVDYSRKEDFRWISMIRLPEFVTEEVLEWAKKEVAEKKKLDASCARFLTLDEGLCVQCMHTGSYDDEPATLAKMERYAAENGHKPDFSANRRHHEIYLSDPRRTAPEKLKTVIRYPVKKG